MFRAAIAVLATLGPTKVWRQIKTFRDLEVAISWARQTLDTAPE